MCDGGVYDVLSARGVLQLRHGSRLSGVHFVYSRTNMYSVRGRFFLPVVVVTDQKLVRTVAVRRGAKPKTHVVADEAWSVFRTTIRIYQTRLHVYCTTVGTKLTAAV